MNKAVPARQQFLRYVLVGLGSNAAVYVIYLLLTGWGWNPKVAMSLLYLVGVLQTFVFNKQWSFRFNGAATPAFVRYATVYAVGYVVNLSALLLLVDQMGWPHQWVQGAMIVVVAVMLFVAQRYWVFPATTSGSPA
ncbi:MAG: polysaccharide synthesis protein GtrA [Comamonadaceae bacterium CG12_big_fil_rev_8_21_14_0_65_59_15]|nr:MAG: polysaccharide synthesis protein GtrA [Comamonadaceae bacterium CG12_big_fil_rev_8_21_14_0_65_59_15]